MIINAIVHRDYLIEGAQIKVIADVDKIESEKPAGFAVSSPVWTDGRPASAKRSGCSWATDVAAALEDRSAPQAGLFPDVQTGSWGAPPGGAD